MREVFPPLTMKNFSHRSQRVEDFVNFGDIFFRYVFSWSNCWFLCNTLPNVVLNRVAQEKVATALFPRNQTSFDYRLVSRSLMNPVITINHVPVNLCLRTLGYGKYSNKYSQVKYSHLFLHLLQQVIRMNNEKPMHYAL